MGHIRKRENKAGQTRYQMLVEVWRGGRKYFKSKTFNSEREARQWEKKIRYQIESGVISKESLRNRKLSDAIDKYVSEVLPHKPKNAKNVIQHLNWWKNQIGNTQLVDTIPSIIGECRDLLFKEPGKHRKQRAPATVVRYLSSLSAVFEAAIKEWHWTEKNPVRLIRKPSVSNARSRFLSEEESKKLMTACQESRNSFLYTIVVLALGTGMRKGEILKLKWENVDFEKKLIALKETKNGSNRYIPMVGFVHKALQKYAEEELALNQTHITPSYYLFPSLNPNRYMDIRTAWSFALKKACLSGVRFHDLRHSCASFLAMSGASQRDIAEILGHRDLRTTYRYSHLTQAHLAEALERANKKFISG
jgi:integrase